MRRRACERNDGERIGAEGGERQSPGGLAGFKQMNLLGVFIFHLVGEAFGVAAERQRRYDILVFDLKKGRAGKSFHVHDAEFAGAVGIV